MIMKNTVNSANKAYSIAEEKLLGEVKQTYSQAVKVLVEEIKPEAD